MPGSGSEVIEGFGGLIEGCNGVDSTSVGTETGV